MILAMIRIVVLIKCYSNDEYDDTNNTNTDKRLVHRALLPILRSVTTTNWSHSTADMHMASLQRGYIQHHQYQYPAAPTLPRNHQRITISSNTVQHSMERGGTVMMTMMTTIGRMLAWALMQRIPSLVEYMSF